MLHSFYYLSLHIHRHPEFEFHFKPFLISRNLSSQPPNKLLMVFRDLGCLTIQKFSYLSDSLFQALPLGTHHQSVLLQIMQAIAFIGYAVVVLFGICPSQQFLLQLLQLYLNALHRGFILLPNDRLHVLLQGSHHTSLLPSIILIAASLPPAVLIPEWLVHHISQDHTPHGCSTVIRWSVCHGCSMQSCDKYRRTWGSKLCWIKRTYCCRPASSVSPHCEGLPAAPFPPAPAYREHWE